MVNQLLAGLVLLLLSASAFPQEPDLQQIAQYLISEVAEVRRGEVVLIRGSSESLEIFEELVAETFIAGGHAIPVMDFPGARIRIAQESSMEFLLQERTADLALLDFVDVIIDATPGFTSAVLTLDIPMDRRIAAQDGRSTYQEAISSGTHREVWLGQSSGVPTRTFAADIHADFSEFAETVWRAIAVTEDELESTGDRIAAAMQPGSEIHLSGPNGTDLTFTLSDTPAQINTGRLPQNSPGFGPIATVLPAGEYAACIDPSSANGVVIAPLYRFRFQDITGLSLTFENGVVTDVSAESGGEPLREFLNSLEDPSRALSLVTIGLNNESRVIPGSSYRSWEMGGVVTVLMGDNTESGCDHVANFRLHPHIEGLTLTADGFTVVANGAIQ